VLQFLLRFLLRRDRSTRESGSVREMARERERKASYSLEGICGGDGLECGLSF